MALENYPNNARLLGGCDVWGAVFEMTYTAPYMTSRVNSI